MNSIKIDYDYRFLDFSDDKNKSLCMICFKGGSKSIFWTQKS